MPGYASLLLTGDRVWDFFFTIIFGAIGIFGKIFNSDVARVVTYYAIYGRWYVFANAYQKAN
jgi:hypothetical protein